MRLIFCLKTPKYTYKSKAEKRTKFPTFSNTVYDKMVTVQLQCYIKFARCRSYQTEDGFMRLCEKAETLYDNHCAFLEKPG